MIVYFSYHRAFVSWMKCELCELTLEVKFIKMFKDAVCVYSSMQDARARQSAIYGRRRRRAQVSLVSMSSAVCSFHRGCHENGR